MGKGIKLFILSLFSILKVIICLNYIKTVKNNTYNTNAIKSTHKIHFYRKLLYQEQSRRGINNFHNNTRLSVLWFVFMRVRFSLFKLRPSGNASD